jgi:hypothetical protein
MALALRLRTEVVDHDYGHWCNTCLLATGVRAVTALVAGHTPLRLSQTLICSECMGRDIEVNPDASHC